MVKFIERQTHFVPAETEGIKQELDLPYADGERQQLDLYWPDTAQGPYPVIIDIHGGGMYFGAKSSQKLAGALELRKQGYAIVSPNYSLSYMAPFPQPVYEIKAVIRWVKAHAAEYQLDPDNVYLMGESSGAQLAMLAAASSGAGQLQSPLGGNFHVSDRVNGVIASYGPYDLALMKAQFAILNQTPKFAETGDADSFEGVMLGFHRPADVPELNAMANPATYLNQQMVPVLMYAGTGDRVVPYLQTINLAAQIATVIGQDQVEVHIVADVPHGPSGFLTAKVTQQKENFLKRNRH
ncbi:alpha/beta hydrolase [Fructilactobacillus cliffordii]|uniref:Alpha/beta hydrolase n=1 Tax=Fructilactobacillus cliffordii TaxID=2940299 RepID=A0A9Q8ZV31_9LACO|nr:alpha/beta hydrolase [Fructilactobacillus cliffordii]USS89051.1 alpha/beta hydrolase [Fructilactobacillus cliffordii]